MSSSRVLSLALEKWGIGPDVLMAKNGGLVIVRVSGGDKRGPTPTNLGSGA